MKKLFKNSLKISVLVLTILVGSFIYENFKHYQFRSYIEKDPFYKTDSISGHSHQINTTKKLLWIEHSEDTIEMKTNNLGFREDKQTPISSLKERILVTGDSHTDGLIPNKESFPNVLELMQKNKISIINAGHGFYSFKNYLGVLKKNLYLNPDQFIITVYTGNDFIENLLYEEHNLQFFESWKYCLFRVEKKINYLTTGIESSQHINQGFFFKRFPQLMKESLSISKSYLNKIKTICTKEGIKLKVLVLPSELDIDTNRKEQFLKKGVSKDIILINELLKKGFISQLETSQIEHFDLTPSFKESKQDLFWDTDSHLNSNGHKLIAQKTKNFILK